MNKWKDYKVSELINIIGGGTPKTKVSEYWDGDIPWLSVKDFNSDLRKVYDTEKCITRKGLENSSTKLLDEGDIIISARGTVGALAQLGKIMAFNQSCYGLSANNLSTNDFIYYLLKNMIGNIQQNTHGSVFDTITRNTFDILKATIPPLQEQKDIANILSTLDEKIEVNNKINKTIEEMAQAIFKHWFVDFEFPNEEGEPYKSSGGEMVESELGPIPKGWEVDSLYSVADIIYGAPFSSRLFNEEGKGLPLIRIRDLKTGQPQFYTTENHRKGTVIIPGDILIGMDAEFIPTIWRGEKALLNQRVCQLKSNKKFIHDQYLYELIKPHMEMFEFSKTGTTVIHLGKKDIDSIKVIISTKSLVESYSSLVGPIHKELVNLSVENRELQKLRDTLLPKLMSGEIRVPLDTEEQ